MEQQEEYKLKRQTRKEVKSMKQKQVTYRFHNPNPKTVMEDYIQKIMVVNGVKDIASTLQNETQQKQPTVNDYENEF